MFEVGSMNFVQKLQTLPLKHDGVNWFVDWFDTLTKEQQKIVAQVKNCLEPLLNSAPYLAHITQKYPDFLCEVLSGDVEETIVSLFKKITKLSKKTNDEMELGSVLRQAKLKISLLVALAEVGGVLTPKQSTFFLANFADVALEACLTFLIRQAASEGKLNEENITVKNCGLAIFALGKHGGGELNYSSDIDIVAFYDPQKNVLEQPENAQKFYTKIMRSVFKLMDERTVEGYVFRTDLRLRPDPGSTPIAISFDGALAYYEARGQNWERAAWIKARHCAGDKNVGADFLKNLSPFIWRKHLDFAAIADIQAMKRQINIAKNVGNARVEGHNVKLGRGGIREIEFFVQTQQLIAGGRDVSLREKPTIKALNALAKAGWITKKAAVDLNKAYWYLRAVENRLQMLNDEQTHIMPDTKGGIKTIALLMGEASEKAFEEKYKHTLFMVMKYYSELFENEKSLASDIGDLVFTGTDDDPDTIKTLQKIGFDDAHLAAKTIRKWHYGAYAATRASAARAHLTELLPSLLSVIGAGGNSDEALAKFDHFLSQFPAGVQLFSLLRNNENLCQMLVAFMASAPRLAEAVIHRAHVMDALIDPAFVDGISETKILIDKVDSFLSQANGFEDLIDRARIIGQEQKFLIGAGFISGAVDAKRAGKQFSALAQVLLEQLFSAVKKEFVKKHGEIKGAKTGLLAFGKFASNEMTATSDLDFILFYDAPENAQYSDGKRPLAISHYYARLTQRLVAALSAPTSEGVLYEADMRLRPSGNAGPLATSLKAFLNYQKTKAWTWEHLALTRARVVGSDGELKEKMNKAIKEILLLPNDKEKIIKDVKEMRELMAKERKARHNLDLKLLKGGLVDIEFLMQSAQLLYADKFNNKTPIIKQLGELNLIRNADRLNEIYQFYAIVLQAMSICLIDPFGQKSWTNAFKNLLAQLTNSVSFERLEEDLLLMQKDVILIVEEFYTS